MTNQTDIDALIAKNAAFRDATTEHELPSEGSIIGLWMATAAALESTAAELRQERERAERVQANEREAWGVANTRLDAYTDATRALSRAEETIAAIRAARSNHPECDAHGDADPVTCGWKRAVQDIDAALAAHEKGQQS